MRWAKLKLGAAVAFAIAVASCATPAPAPIVLTTTYSPEEIAWSKEKGTGVIEGEALMRTVGGEPRTCAAIDALLVADSSHARERLMSIYESLEVGVRYGSYSPPFANDDPRFVSDARRATCNSSGKFRFSELPAGTYYVVVPVIWGMPAQYGVSEQGARFLRKVVLAPGETKQLVISN